ncbi:MAG: hypothetical protein FJ145_23065 [Deltaproteobacteria bacterium]|nr:hypothetical protein [Deltaproteobacteria bacterium]
MNIKGKLLSVALGAGMLFAGQLYAAEMMMKSGAFKGPKANTGHVTSSKEGGKIVLALSDNFKTPDAPDPHWQVIDSKGTVFMLQKIALKDNKMNRKITLPDYVNDVSKVVIWCAWAEASLGEASFDKPVM